MAWAWERAGLRCEQLSRIEILPSGWVFLRKIYTGSLNSKVWCPILEGKKIDYEVDSIKFVTPDNIETFSKWVTGFGKLEK